MKKLLILSGKGGTGKTTTAASFIAFSGSRAFADCDVDAPNLHLVTQMKTEPARSPFFGADKARIDPARCISCGACEAHCRFHAVVQKENRFEISPLACEGCGVCEAVCPAGAVTLEPDTAGELMLYQDERTFSTACLKMGRGNSGKLVTEVKASMAMHAPKTDLAVIDGSPGIGCPVIASVSGMNLVLIVTEPSFSGISDLKRLLKTCSVFGCRTAVCVNRYDTCPENTAAIEDFCREQQIPFAGRIPFDPHVPEAVNKGISIADIDCPARTALREIYDRIMLLIHE